MPGLALCGNVRACIFHLFLPLISSNSLLDAQEIYSACGVCRYGTKANKENTASLDDAVNGVTRKLKQFALDETLPQDVDNYRRGLALLNSGWRGTSTQISRTCIISTPHTSRYLY